MKHTMRYLSLLLLACSFSSGVYANLYPDQDGSCASRCYECGCNPLYCGAFDLEVQAGVEPIVWRNREEISLVSCPVSAGANPVNDLFEVPNFNKLFRVPWTIGGQLGYAVSDNIRVYLELNYAQARGKDAVDIVSASVVFPDTFSFSLNKYRLFDAYVGLRYYWDRWCDRTSFFLGVKAGLVRRKNLTFSASVTSLTPVVVLASDVNFASGRTAPSGGVNIGLDFCFCGNWSFVLTGELVANCGPASNNNLPLTTGSCSSIVPATAIANNLIIGRIGTELRFPITAGIRYSF